MVRSGKLTANAQQAVDASQVVDRMPGARPYNSVRHDPRGPGPAPRCNIPLPASLDAGAAVPAFPPLQVVARRAVRLAAGRAMPRAQLNRGDLLRIVAVRAADDLDAVAVGPGQGAAAAVLPAAAAGTGGRKGHGHAFRCRAIREHTGRAFDSSPERLGRCPWQPLDARDSEMSVTLVAVCSADSVDSTSRTHTGAGDAISFDSVRLCSKKSVAP